MGRPTTLVVQVRRFECRCGHRFTPEHPELAGKITRRLARTLVADVRKLTVRELVRRQCAYHHSADRGADSCRAALMKAVTTRADGPAMSCPSLADANARNSCYCNGRAQGC